jgi:anti-anti-sigma factor
MQQLGVGGQASARVGVDAPDAETVVLRLEGELDVSNVDALEQIVTPRLEAGVRRVIVDAGELAFADSSAIAMWLRWAAAGPSVEVRNPSPVMRRVLDGLGLTEVLSVA